MLWTYSAKRNVKSVERKKFRLWSQMKNFCTLAQTKIMKANFVILTLLLWNLLSAQTIQEIDSMTFEFCDFIKESQLSDQKKLDVLQDNLIIPYIRKFKNANAEQVFNQIFFRMQRNCLEFELLLDRLYPNPEQLERTKTKPECKLSNDELLQFKKIKKFYYTEHDGTKTKVRIEDGKWKERFKDKSYSRLHMRWMNESEFELEFIESNNFTRKNLSIPGDKYFYYVISKESNYYWVAYSSPNKEQFVKFKLYFK